MIDFLTSDGGIMIMLMALGLGVAVYAWVLSIETRLTDTMMDRDLERCHKCIYYKVCERCGKIRPDCKDFFEDDEP